jgi:adenylyltransferase/sulfurtransferase
MQARAVLVGCGGLGTVLADTLVRAGVGFLRIVDRDFVEESNLQRQILFDQQDVKDDVPKAVAAERRLRAINPEVEIEAVVKDVAPSSILDLIRDVDLILDGTDNFETRYLINDAAVSEDKPWVYGAAVGSSGMTATIIPAETPCLRCLYEDSPPPGTAPTCDNAGVLSPVIHIIASVQASEALKLLSGARDQISRKMLFVDVWEGTYRSVKAPRRSDCKTCGKREFEYLQAERGSFVTTMCGRNAVQLSWKEAHEVKLADVAESLGKSGEVSFNKFMLKFRNEEVTITLFPDGRAIIEGTSDTERARELYTKFIG